MAAQRFPHISAAIVPRQALLFVAVSIVLVAGRTGAQKPEDLKPQGYINDFAGVLSGNARAQLTALCTQVNQKAQAQIAVVTVKSLGGRPVEDYTIDLATRWGVGPKQKDRGVMILLATDDHKYRFEVGYDLEGILTDGKVGGFGREAVPFLRQNNYDAAILLMTRRVADVIAADRGVTLTSEPQAGGGNSNSGSDEEWGVGAALSLVVFFFFLFWALRHLFATPGRRRFGGGGWIGPMMGGWGGGGFGGGGWGGGGWGGGGGGGGGSGGFGGFGGGSFGGGGASGSW